MLRFSLCVLTQPYLTDLVGLDPAHLTIGMPRRRATSCSDSARMSSSHAVSLTEGLGAICTELVPCRFF